MSYHGKYSSSGSDSRRREHSSNRRSSPSRHHRRRSPSPGPSRSRGSPSRPRDPKNLPDSFGRVLDSGREHDDLNILQRMKSAYDNSPLNGLNIYVTINQKVKIWTRNYKEVRGVMTGYIVAFDKHWNLILRDVDEVYLKHKKCKTPFLRDVAASENLPDMPVKVPRPKKSAQEKAESAPPQPTQSEGGTTGEGEKKKRKKKKNKNTSEKRQVDKLFVRGDNVVMITPINDEGATIEVSDTEEGEEEEEEAGQEST